MTQGGQNDSALEREVTYFHDYFFRGPLDRDVLSRYVAANRRCLPSVESECSRMIEKIVSLALDIEAIEFVLRQKKRDNCLTRKIQILFFLVEVRSRYFGYFFNCRNDRFSGIMSLLRSILITPYKYVKGVYLIRKYELV